MRLLSILAALIPIALTVTQAEEARREHIFADQEHLDIHLNKHVADLMTQINKSDKLVLVYIFHTGISHDANGQDWSMLDKMFFKVLEELKSGYVTTYAIDCADEHPEVDPEVVLKTICERKDFQPVFTLYKPAEIKINPYTGKEMPYSIVPFASNQVSDPDVKKWITDNIPDYTQRLSTMEDADQFAAEKGIKKVYLFSAKQKVPPIYKALAQNFRNRIRFAFVNLESATAKILPDQFKTEKWPTLLVANESGEGHFVFDGKMKLEELIEFVEPHTLPKDQAKEERVISSKKQTTVNQQVDSSGYALLTSVADINEKILDDWKGALLYIGQKDSLTYLPIIEDIGKEYGVFLNVCLLVVEDVAESNADLKREFKTAKLPQLRFYPNIKTGQDKRSASFEIILPKTDDMQKIRETVLEEVKSGYTTDVKDVTEKVYYSTGHQNSKDGKITILYMYDGGGVDFTYKAVSADPWMQNDYVFMAIDGPSDSLKQEGPLPAIQGMLAIDEENPSPRIFSFSGMRQVHYGEVVKQLLKLVPGKYEAFEEDWRIKTFKKQNPGQDTEAAKNPRPREFKEISGMKDFTNLCKANKACAIAILPAITTIDYEYDNFTKKLAMLSDIDKQAGKIASPVHYGWLNATCHAEIFSYFDVDPTALPTMLFYNSQHNKYATMIGAFNKESIDEHEEKFKNGKLALREAKVDKREMKFTEVDCQAQLLNVVEEDPDFENDLKEIMEEDRKRREEMKVVKKKATKKGGKKGNKKNSASDEL